MKNSSYIKLKYKNFELEIQGKEDFIEKQLSNIDDILRKLSFLIEEHSTSITSNDLNNSTKTSSKSKYSIEEILKKNFSVWKKAFSKETNNVIIYLIAGYYIQLNSKNNSFNADDISKLLSRYNININDINKCKSHNLKVGNIIPINELGVCNEYKINDNIVNLINDFLDFCINEM
ncbi:hypothetical protein SAMN02745135_01989 [Caloranaerobacter azorensis DSM 13643]|uniref:Uncharacterized protein n=1 Tax=Caloranaerobacter azorensis DSM 13643 TaxID=1121264 RepID=A0A1M5VKV4_9FIRM|nr:hypothetical protein [Caloranaerobacter azorensis]SHH75830.1 hypothetical protein SAMN02745135_01989 [Caloranaerobacter azorensis DSM 13643]